MNAAERDAVIATCRAILDAAYHEIKRPGFRALTFEQRVAWLDWVEWWERSIKKVKEWKVGDQQPEEAS